MASKQVKITKIEEDKVYYEIQIYYVGENGESFYMNGDELLNLYYKLQEVVENYVDD